MKPPSAPLDYELTQLDQRTEQLAHDEYEHQRRQTVAMQDAVNRTLERIEMARRTGAVPPRPCCHATGPNHHPACTTDRTEEQQ